MPSKRLSRWHACVYSRAYWKPDPAVYRGSRIQPRPSDNPEIQGCDWIQELVRQGILISAQCGADALTIGHYDGAWLDCLRAIKDGIEVAGVVVDRNALAFAHLK